MCRKWRFALMISEIRLELCAKVGIYVLSPNAQNRGKNGLKTASSSASITSRVSNVRRFSAHKFLSNVFCFLGLGVEFLGGTVFTYFSWRMKSVRELIRASRTLVVGEVTAVMARSEGRNR
jgi:hypothetical protein